MLWVIIPMQERKTCAFFLVEHWHFIHHILLTRVRHPFLHMVFLQRLSIRSQWNVIECYKEGFLSLQVSLVTIIIIFLLNIEDPSKKQPNNPQEHKSVQHPWGESSKSTAGVGLTEIPTGGPQGLQARVWIHLSGGSGFFWNMFVFPQGFIEGHICYQLLLVDCRWLWLPRGIHWVALMRFLSRKYMYRIYIDYEDTAIGHKRLLLSHASVRSLRIWRILLQCVAKATSVETSDLGGPPRASLSMRLICPCD